MKDLLEMREDDLRFLKREKRYVESLLRQFGRVKHLVQGGWAPRSGTEELRGLGEGPRKVRAGGHRGRAGVGT